MSSEVRRSNLGPNICSIHVGFPALPHSLQALTRIHVAMSSCLADNHNSKMWLKENSCVLLLYFGVL